jgi:4'-phosphopantetheinyl transferase
LPGVIPPAITLWYALTADVADPALLRACFAALSAEEEAKHHAFVFEKNRHEYVVSRALCRGVLATYTGSAAADLVFTRNPFGQPALDPPGALRFSVTNTVHLVACGITTGFAVGIDAEPLASGDTILGISDSVFTAHERSELARLPLPGRRRQAVRLWTLKEAYMKARGMGMHLSPTTFEIGFDEHPRLRQVEDGDLPSRWDLTTLELEGHILATCVERADGATMPHHIVTRRADLTALLC